MTEKLERHPNGDAKLPVAGCPVCATRFEGVADARGKDAMLSPGQVTICLGCAAILEIGVDLVPVRLSAATSTNLSFEEHRQIALDVRSVRMMHAQNQAKND